MGTVITSAQFHRILTDAAGLLSDAPRLQWPTSYTCEIAGLESAIVTVSYDQGRLGEVTISLEQLDQGEPAFEIADVLRTAGCPLEESSRYEAIQTVDSQVLEDLLRAAFASLTRYGREFLSGDARAFERARIDRSRRALTYTSSINDSLALEAADDAWRHGELDEVVNLLRPLESRLSARELRRLEFALRKAAEEY